MFEGYEKYLLIKYCWECGTDDGSDHHTKKEAETAARRYLREGWETVACINTEAKRIEFVFGEPGGVLKWFVPAAAEVLKQNSRIPEYLYK